MEEKDIKEQFVKAVSSSPSINIEQWHKLQLTIVNTMPPSPRLFVNNSKDRLAVSLDYLWRRLTYESYSPKVMAYNKAVTNTYNVLTKNMPLDDYRLLLKTMPGSASPRLFKAGLVLIVGSVVLMLVPVGLNLVLTLAVGIACLGLGIAALKASKSSDISAAMETVVKEGLTLGMLT